MTAMREGEIYAQFGAREGERARGGGLNGHFADGRQRGEANGGN